MYQFIRASAHATGLPEKSVHAVITSPPYWGLRKYAGDQGIMWDAVSYAPMAGLPQITIPAMQCGLGEEPTPEAYIGHLILVMREMWRVLRDDATCWVNLGDSYAGSWGNYGGQNRGQGKQRQIVNGSLVGSKAYEGKEQWRPPTSNGPPGLKPKDLVQIPARFALAAQADGWWVRSDIIWAKPNPMPESVTDRPTKAHEYIYLLAKSPRYFYDNEAIKEPLKESSIQRISQPTFGEQTGGEKDYGANGVNSNRSMRRTLENFAASNGVRFGGNKADGYGTRLASGNEWQATSGANKRSVWNVPTSPYHGAHFATWPEALVETMVLASTSARGVCPQCGAPWKRVMEKIGEIRQRWKEGAAVVDAQWGGGVGASSVIATGNVAVRQTVGWKPTCQCSVEDVVPATVLDPFNGSGTTGRVANRLGRAYIGVDVAEEYLTDLSAKRMENIQYEMSW